MNMRQAVRENRIWKLVDKLQNTQWVHPGQITDWIRFFVGIPYQHFHLQLRQMRGKFNTARRGLGTLEPLHQELKRFTEETKLWYCNNYRLVAVFILLYHFQHSRLLTERTDCFSCVQAAINVSFVVMFSEKIATIWSSLPSKSAARSPIHSISKHHLLLTGNLFPLKEDTYVFICKNYRG